MAFWKHQESRTHWGAAEAIVTLPKTTHNVGEQLSKAQKAEKVNSHKMLHIVPTSLRYLGRQNLAIRGNTSEESNLIQLLHLRADDNPGL